MLVVSKKDTGRMNVKIAKEKKDVPYFICVRTDGSLAPSH